MNDSEQAANQIYKRLHGTVPSRTIHVPGCVPWLGSATLAHGGLLLASPTHLGATIVCSPRDDAWIELATGENDRIRVRPHALNGPAPSPAMEIPWLALRQLRLERIHFGGFNAVFRSDLPAALKLFSAPAMAAASVLAIRELYPFGLGESGLAAPPRLDASGRLPSPTGLDRIRLGRLAARSLERQALPLVLAALAARPWEVVSVDARFGNVETLPLPGFVAVLSMRSEPGTDAAADQRQRNLEQWGAEATRKLGVTSLRVFDLPDLTAARARLTPSEYASARLILEEITRTVAAERALREGDATQFGQYLLDSLPNQTGPAKAGDSLAAIVNHARGFPGCLGSVRLPGAIAHLVSHHAVPAFTQALSRLDPGVTHQVLAAAA